MDKSGDISADDFGGLLIKEITALASSDEDTYTEEGYGLAIRHAVQKIKDIYKRETGYDLSV